MENAKRVMPGLLSIKDLIERIPAERERILEYEIKSREREILQTKGLRRVMHLQAWSSFRTVLAVGLSVFIVVFALGQLAGLARWVQEIRGLGFSLPGFGTGRFSPGSVIPTSTIMEIAADIPSLGPVEAGLISLAVVLALLVWKGYVAYVLMVQARGMRNFQKDLEGEIRLLKGWLNDASVDQKRKTD